MMGVAATTQTAVLPKIAIPYDADQQVASTTQPLGSWPQTELSCLGEGQEGARFVRGTLMAALLSLPFWFALFLVVWFWR